MAALTSGTSWTSLTLPALLLAQRYAQKATQVGFDGPPLPAILDEVRDRLDGLADERRDRGERELGDALFAMCQLAQRLGLNAEDCLRTSAQRFAERAW